MKRLLLLCLLCLPGCFFASFYRSEWPEPVERHVVVTEDGWRLDLRHVAPLGGPRRERPVVLQHGIVTSGRNMDLDEKHSLARHLAREGFDVWIPSLRGVGESEKRDENHSFDEHVLYDVPAVISYVLERTKAPELDWVGHSMGGMLLYAHLSRGGGGVARAVTLGSPVRFLWTGELESLARRHGALASKVRWPLQALTRSAMPLHGSWSGPAELLLTNPVLTKKSEWQKLLAVAIDDPPPALIAQFVGWIERDRFDSLDGTVDYLGGLSEVKVPMLVVAGPLDGIAPPWNVRPAFDVLGSEEKRWLLLSEANGMTADYNHMDMLLSAAAARDLFPHLVTFLSTSESR